MSSIPKFLKKDEFEWKKWRAKKVIEHRDFTSKLAKNYKNRQQRFFTSFSNHKTKTTSKSLSRSKEVLIKITSNSKHYQSICSHIDYVSRQGTLQLITSDLNYYLGKEENKELKEAFRIYGETTPNKNEEKKELRQTYNMVFSMKEHSTTPPAKLKQAVFKTLKENYPQNFFSLVFHDDTDNPHCHVCLKISKVDGTRIDIRKNDLAHLRKEFARNLNLLGIEASASSKRVKELGINLAKREEILDRLSNKTKVKIKHHNYKVLDYAEAKFDFKDENNTSFFVKYLSSKGETIIWGKDLKRLIKEYEIQKGEYVRFAKIGYKLEAYSFKKKIKDKYYEVHTQRKIPIWDASISNRAEKSFTKLPPVKIHTELKEIKTQRINKDERRRYSKEEWAIYYANKRRTIHISDNAYSKKRSPAKSSNHLQTLSQIHMVWKRNRNEMFLHSNAQHKLEFRGKGQGDNSMRRTDTSPTRTSKRVVKDLIKAQKSNEKEI